LRSDYRRHFSASGPRDFSARRYGAFRLRLRAPDGTHIAKSEQYAKQALEIISKPSGRKHVDLSLGYVA